MDRLIIIVNQQNYSDAFAQRAEREQGRHQAGSSPPRLPNFEEPALSENQTNQIALWLVHGWTAPSETRRAPRASKDCLSIIVAASRIASTSPVLCRGWHPNSYWNVHTQRSGQQPMSALRIL